MSDVKPVLVREISLNRRSSLIPSPTCKYKITMLSEERFKGMIWDVAFLESGDLLVSSSEGATVLDVSLVLKKHLEQVVLGGGIGFMDNGDIVVVCRNFDTVNFFSPETTYKRSFDAGPSPQGLAVNSKDQIIVSDTGTKTIRIYDPSGKLLREILSTGENYHMKWPLYIAINSKDELFVSDCHLQRVFKFDPIGKFIKYVNLFISIGSSVLRPHGICIGTDDYIFLVDMAVDSLEVFHENESHFQTLLQGSETMLMRLKCAGVCQDKIAIGGLTGLIRIYKFTRVERSNPSTPTKRDSRVSPLNREQSTLKIVQQEPPKAAESVQVKLEPAPKEVIIID